MENSVKRILFFIIGGFAAGLANGLLGAGGGIIAVYVLSSQLRSKNGDTRDIFANALAVMLPLSLISIGSYVHRGNISLFESFKYLIPAIAGGFTGGILLGKSNPLFLRIAFSLITAYSGISLMVR